MKTPLTPMQQALLQFVESILITAVMAGLFSIGPFIDGTGPIDWKTVAGAFLLAFAFSLAHSLVAYFKPAQATLIEAMLNALEQRYSPPAQASQKPIAQPQTTIRPNVQMNVPQPAMASVAPNPGLVWTPLQGRDVSAMQTSPQQAMPPQQ